MDAMLETLLTVWALSQCKEQPAISVGIPARLQSTLRKARKLEYVSGDSNALYLDEAGCVYLAEHGNPQI